jgi:hypothetical protein
MVVQVAVVVEVLAEVLVLETQVHTHLLKEMMVVLQQRQQWAVEAEVVVLEVLVAMQQALAAVMEALVQTLIHLGYL